MSRKASKETPGSPRMSRAVLAMGSKRPARVVIESVSPEIDGGRFPVKRTMGEAVTVEADVFADGHDAIACVLLFRKEGGTHWSEIPMEALGNDRWRGRFVVTEAGRYSYMLQAWVDRFGSWRADLLKKFEAGQDVSVELLGGADLLEETAKKAPGADARKLLALARRLHGNGALSSRVSTASGEELKRLMARCEDKAEAVTYARELSVIVDRERARFSAWYEMFPRSASPEPGRHGTFKDCEARLAYVAEMGFDVLYLPPIHPIGRTHRKGRNNTSPCRPGEPGSPWAIGGEEGGHTAIHPELGSLDDFRRLVARARELGMEIALDIAFHCSPDHPYVKEHPEWFRWRADGTVQYAENPPKKYQDIYPLNFDTADWEGLWKELKNVVLYWVAQGVRIFRVDNPHTKPFRFWDWLISGIKKDHPDVLFLSEAFTRPKIMYRLAKLGFTQSYNYFPWRNTSRELREYFTELTQTEVREFFRPNLWPNTPDILTACLQEGGRPAFMSRLILAATLGASYGIYGPGFELCENRPLERGKEEYLDSEKYQIRHWDIENPESLKGLITRVNQIRRDNPALQHDRNLRFHPTDNEQLLCYSKRADDPANRILVVVNLDHRYMQSGWVQLQFDSLRLDPSRPYQLHDLISGASYRWQGERNYVELDPQAVPAHIFSLDPGEPKTS